LRSRPATRIAKATVEHLPAEPEAELGDPRAERGWTPVPPAVASNAADSAAVACSLENPETCEACQ
jgi:ribonucleoside-diphosphate reductase alpha chain